MVNGGLNLPNHICSFILQCVYICKNHNKVQIVYQFILYKESMKFHPQCDTIPPTAGCYSTAPQFGERPDDFHDLRGPIQ